jgi:outer membrane protein assembly factor BamB
VFAHRLRLLAAAVVICAALSLQLLPAAGADDSPLGIGVSWTTYGFDLQRTGYNPSETTLGTGNASHLHVRWTANLGDVMIAQPVEAANVSFFALGAKNVIYEGTEHGDFYALDATTGQMLWRRNLGSIQTGCSDMPDGIFGIGGAGVIDRSRSVVYVAGGDGSVHSLDLATGRESTGWPVKNVFTPSHDHVYGGINERTGMLYVVVASHCDFAPYKGRVTEISTLTRTVVKSFYPATSNVDGGGIWGPGGASIDPANGHVFVATGNALTNPESYSYSEDVVELDPSLNVLGANYPGLVGGDVDFGATPILYRPSGCPTTQVAAKNKSGVFVVYNEGGLNAGYTQRFQIADVNDYQFNGIPAWDPVTNMLYISNNSDSNTGIYFHGLVALHAATNCQLSLAWQQTVGPNYTSDSPPTVANGVVYYGDGYGHTERAFNAQTGALLWSSGSMIGGGLYAAPTVVNGMLYVPAWDGKLYAFSP